MIIAVVDIKIKNGASDSFVKFVGISRPELLTAFLILPRF